MQLPLLVSAWSKSTQQRLRRRGARLGSQTWLRLQVCRALCSPLVFVFLAVFLSFSFFFPKNIRHPSKRESFLLHVHFLALSPVGPRCSESTSSGHTSRVYGWKKTKADAWAFPPTASTCNTFVSLLFPLSLQVQEIRFQISRYRKRRLYFWRVEEIQISVRNPPLPCLP